MLHLPNIWTNILFQRRVSRAHLWCYTCLTFVSLVSATSLLGSFIMLLLVLVSTAPPSAASIPKLGLFYAFNICIIVLSLCLSAIVINVSKLGDKGCKVPKVIDKVRVVLILILVYFSLLVMINHSAVKTDTIQYAILFRDTSTVFDTRKLIP